MDNSKINILSLLDKYWAGESSLQDEEQLRTYFLQSNVDDDLRIYQPLFEFFREEKGLTIDLSDQVMARLQNVENIPVKRINRISNIISIGWQRTIAVAASVLLLLTLGINMYKNPNPANRDLSSMDTFESPEEALEQTKAALLYLSSRMNKATDKATLSISKAAPLDLIN